MHRDPCQISIWWPLTIPRAKSIASLSITKVSGHVSLVVGFGRRDLAGAYPDLDDLLIEPSPSRSSAVRPLELRACDGVTFRARDGVTLGPRNDGEIIPRTSWPGMAGE